MSHPTDPHAQPGLHESDIMPFMGNNSAQPPAADTPMGTVMSFMNAGVMYGAANSILGAIEDGMAQLAGGMPNGMGTEPALAERGMAPNMAPQMTMNQQPGFGRPT
ncbi:MAG: hypothetical protein ACK4VI_07845 [Alphaproteobacteria bacterium]